MSTFHRIMRLAASAAVIVGLGKGALLLPHVHAATLVLVMLLAILLIANRWGFAEAATAVVIASALVDYFFLPPRGVGIAYPEHWVVFFTFVTVGLVAGNFAARTKRQAEENRARRVEMEKLYAFGRDLSIDRDTESFIAKCLALLVRTFDAKGAAFYHSDTDRVTWAGSIPDGISQEQLGRGLNRPNILDAGVPSSSLVPIHCGKHSIGTLAVCGGNISESSFSAIAGHIEVGIEKILAREEQRQAEKARESEEIKSAVLDALVHEIKTPLSVMKTAVSTLLSRDADASTRHELLTIIDEETDRLDLSISEVFQAARAKPESLQADRNSHDIGLLLREALDEVGPLIKGREVTVNVADALPFAQCDSKMIKGVLKELLTNATKFSSPSSPLVAMVNRAGSEIVAGIKDCGMGIPSGDRERIFERHYRGSADVPGMGIGLTVAKTIIEGHGGRIWVESQPGVGSVFSFSLPASQQDVA